MNGGTGSGAGGDPEGMPGGDVGSGGALPGETGGSATAGAGTGGKVSGGTTAAGGTGGKGTGGIGGKGSGGTSAAGGTGGSSTGGSSTGGDSTGGGNVGGGPVRVGVSVFQDSASGTDQASSHLTDASFPRPAGLKAGDFMLVFFGADHSLQQMTAGELMPNGWTLIDQRTDYGGDGQAFYLVYKFAGASEPNQIVFAGINPPSSGNGVQGLLSVYRGVNSAQPINAYDKALDKTGNLSAPQGSIPTPAITTSVPGCLALAGLSPDSRIDAPVVSTWPDGFVQNQMSVKNPPTPYPLGWANIYMAERPLPSAGLVPASAFVWQNEQVGYYGALSFVLALAP
jgi:hypothetical protein